MKKITIGWLIIVCCGYLTTVKGQSTLTTEATPLYASFKFTDSEENKSNKDYAGIFTGGYGIGYRLITNGGFVLNADIGMRSAGATMVYDDMNYSWKLQYANAKLGIGYMLLNEKVSPYLIASGYFGYLVSGYQTINNEDFNIKKSDAISSTDYGIVVMPGIQINVSDEISVYFEFNYLMGLKNLEKDENQKSSNYAYGLTLGLSFAF